MSERVPDGWEIKTLGNLAKVKRGASPRPIQDPKWWGGNVGWTRISDVTSSRKYLTKTSNYLSKAGVEKSVKIPVGEVILSICATIGRPIIIKMDACIHDGFVWFDGLKKDIDREFYYYFLSSKEKQLASSRQTGTQGNLNTDIVSRLAILLPPLPEQKKIASILSPVDEVIETTQRQIDKLHDLKKATMNELLTKGIGHTEFKDSELGRIPKSWEVVAVGDISEFVTSGSRGWSQYYSEHGATFIRIGNLTRDNINLNFDDIVMVTPPDGGEGTRTKVSLGDILISITADLGVIGVVYEGMGEAYVNQHVSLVRLKDISQINPRWVGHYLSAKQGQKQFQTKNDGGAKSGLNLPTIRSIKIAKPSILEQEKIYSMLDSFDELITDKRQKLRQTQSLKKSLMQDLLTGKVRVKVN